MKSTMDRAGRVVIPIDMRRALGLMEGGPVEITSQDGHVVISARPVTKRVVEQEGIAVCVADEPMPTLTADEVRAVLEATRH
jgi:AbrB family looped-hinge helix DNA binding protein